MRRRTWWAVLALAAVTVGAAVAWSQHEVQDDAKAAQARVEALWTAIARGDVEGIVGCMHFPVTLIEVSSEDQPGLVEAKTEEELRNDLAKLPRSNAAAQVALTEAKVELSGCQMACVSYRLPANTKPFVGSEGPSERLATVLAKVDGAWKVVVTGLPM